MDTTSQSGGSETDDLAEHYLQWTEESLGEMHSALAEYSANGGDMAVYIDTLYGIAHNIKGMGSSFGFPLMTAVGASCCKYLRSLGEGVGPCEQVITAHLTAMNSILVNRITGDGGENGEKLVKRLENIVADALQTV